MKNTKWKVSKVRKRTKRRQIQNANQMLLLENLLKSLKAKYYLIRRRPPFQLI
jgi:hypothetical protein